LNVTYTAKRRALTNRSHFTPGSVAGPYLKGCNMTGRRKSVFDKGRLSVADRQLIASLIGKLNKELGREPSWEEIEAEIGRWEAAILKKHS
jgi:hypothetical protein